MKIQVLNILTTVTREVKFDKSFSSNETVEFDIVFLLKRCFDYAISDDKFAEQELVSVDCIIDRTWERLNTGHWKDIPLIWRHLYAYASYLKVIILLKYSLSSHEDKTVEGLKKALEAADLGLLLGSSCREELSRVAHSLCQLLHSASGGETRHGKFNCTLSTSPVPVSHSKKSIDEVTCPSIEYFLNNHFKPYVPVKLKGCITHWPALELWQNIDYIFEKIGPRTVPVEIGSSYASTNWSQKLMTVRSFVEQYMLNEKVQDVGYLAQHQLFNQIPELLDDIREPDYCILCENDTEGEQTGVDVNAWFGPVHTVSPLHYDPKHNLLVQVVGKKRVLLLDPKWNENVYPFDDSLLHNTSQVDVETPDLTKFPKFASTELLECFLEPGDSLYIPPTWWHHVRSLTPSFSVSFWWGKT